MKSETEIKPKFESQKVEAPEFWRAVRPVVDSKMSADRSCAMFCPHGAIVWTPDQKIKIDYAKCDGCLICLRECHSGAIKEVRD
jgi:2-oxoacid:acceptor oxidoreductase delta subunit (pyruvate/2-ketoisovalerate family)